MATLLDQFGRPLSTTPNVADSIMQAERIAREIRGHFNPIKNLTPVKLRQQHDQFDAGFIGPLARVIATIKEVDDVVPNVAAKREGGPATRGYEIVAKDKSPEAQRHKETLEYFYDNLSCRSAVDLDHVGGVELLFRQQMDAVSSRYAVHEMIWQSSTRGITAELRFAPLWFFERTLGRLRFLADPSAQYGQDLEPGRWLVTVSPAFLGKAISIARLYKSTPLKDWLIYCGRHGMPGIAGKTNASQGSTEWDAMATAVQSFAAEFSAVMSNTDAIESIDLTAKGNLPYPPLVERMDRMMAALYRGADLSTMSAGGGEGTGASLQGDEADILESTDASMISGSLHRQIDRLVIYYRHGTLEPLAGIQVNTSTKDTVEQDLKVDKQLHEMRFPLSIQDLSRRYGRTVPDPDEDLIPTPGSAAPVLPADPGLPAANELSAANQVGSVRAARLRKASMDAYAKAQAREFEPIAQRLQAAIEADDSLEAMAAINELRRDLPGMLTEMVQDSHTTGALEEALVASLINGYAEAAVRRQGEAS